MEKLIKKNKETNATSWTADWCGISSVSHNERMDKMKRDWGHLTLRGGVEWGQIPRHPRGGHPLRRPGRLRCPDIPTPGCTAPCMRSPEPLPSRAPFPAPFTIPSRVEIRVRVRVGVRVGGGVELGMPHQITINAKFGQDHSNNNSAQTPTITGCHYSGRNWWLVDQGGSC